MEPILRYLRYGAVAFVRSRAHHGRLRGADGGRALHRRPTSRRTREAAARPGRAPEAGARIWSTRNGSEWQKLGDLLDGAYFFFGATRRIGAEIALIFRRYAPDGGGNRSKTAKKKGLNFFAATPVERGILALHQWSGANIHGKYPREGVFCHSARGSA